MPATIGVISDTHGLLRDAALHALAGSEFIIHAGDVGKPEVLDTLGQIAPVHAVRGNVDRGAWADALPISRVVELAGMRIYVRHILAELDLDPVEAGYAAVITGHSHKPAEEQRNRVLYLNPGSAGPRRFRLPLSVVRLHVDGKSLRPEFITLPA